MATGITTRSNYDPESFAPGKHLQSGDDFNTLFSATQSVNSVAGLTGLAGGGQVGATPLNFGLNQLDTVTSANDSFALPPAIPGKTVVVNNNGGQSAQIFGIASNFQNASAGDTIQAQGSTAIIVTGTGIALAVGVVTSFICFRLGVWKQSSIT